MSAVLAPIVGHGRVMSDAIERAAGRTLTAWTGWHRVSYALGSPEKSGDGRGVVVVKFLPQQQFVVVVDFDHERTCGVRGCEQAAELGNPPERDGQPCRWHDARVGISRHESECSKNGKAMMSGESRQQGRDHAEKTLTAGCLWRA